MQTDFMSVIKDCLRRALPAFLLVSWAGAQQRPNVLFILVDDMGWADLEGYGSDLHRTPRIDALASQGMRFTIAYSASPVCSPTRASIMTGKHPAKLHMTIWREAATRPPLDPPHLPPITR
ncbi:MAG: sulfatase-like hydrolase/transferase, partial [Acidobacteriia bacterium]|nr:sulfatase-like hydrolase/transferase [Terriglobia bacterium]